jgi:hypothetical protein
MKRYWTRITLGALSIFALGMLAVSAGRQGVEHVKQHVMEHGLNLESWVAPFQVDNRRLGTLTKVAMDPDRSRKFPFINLTVALDPAVESTGLGECTLLASDAESLKGEGLHCISGLSRDSLVEMGAVTFEPSGEVLGLYVPASQMEGLPWFQRASVTTHAPTGEGSFSMQANAAGAFMLIKDEKGRPVFQLNADSDGAFIQIRDSNGKEVVRFRAASQGVVGRVH